MKKLIFLGVAATAMLASCSQEETVSVKSPDEISFRVAAGNQTRARDGYCANELPKSFKAYAKIASDHKILFSGDVLDYKDGEWVNESGTRYWPNEDEVVFYGAVNGDVDMKADSNEPTIDFTVAADPANQLDLLYARKTGKKADGDVAMNFRHALSQVVFKANKTNKNLHVVIEEVSVVNVPTKGTFTFPAADTDETVIDHTQASADPVAANRGSWTTISGSTTYTVALGEALSIDGLTDISATGEVNAKSLLLLPCSINAWDLSDNTFKTQAYFTIKCQIYNIAGSEFDAENDVCLWGKDGAKEIIIPADFIWEDGKKYTYTFVFGNGAGGIDPGTDPDDPDPKPVLVPISFSVTVDDFVKGSDTNLELNKDKGTDKSEN